MKIFLVLGTLLAVQSALSLQDGVRFLRYVRKRRDAPLDDYAPPAAVIVPCKGVGEGFDENIRRFLTQDYERYQLILVVASEKDPAFVRLETLLKSPPSGSSAMPSLIVAGYSESRGEKVHNLLRGLAAVAPDTEVLAFADADARPGSDWLRALVAPLRDSSVTVSTGFRWYLPGVSFASQLRAAWDTSIATLLGDHDHNFAWGGSMALRAAEFKRLQVAEKYWAHTVSDDYAVTRAAREARGRIRFEPRCLLASREDSSFAEFLRWANRQIIITRVYARPLWRLGLLAHGFHCSTFLAGLALLVLPGVPLAARALIAALLAAVVVLNMAKGWLRAMVARELFPAEGATFERLNSRYSQLAPLVPWVMCFNFIVAGLTRRIEWRGTHYELRSENEVRVLRRDG